MKITLVVPSRSDPAHRRVAQALSRELRKAGDSVAIFPPRDRLSAGRLRSGLERRLAKDGVCHVQFFSRGLGYLGRVRFPPQVRLVLTHQGASLRLLEQRAVFARLARRSHSVTCVSREGLGELLQRYPRLKARALAIPNGTGAVKSRRRTRGDPKTAFEGGNLSTDMPRAACRWIISARKHSDGGLRTRSGRLPFILSVARLAAYKGLDILLMAYAGLDPAGRPPLVLCGPDQSGGRLRGFIKKLGLAKSVHLTGETGFNATAALMRDCLYFVLPSRLENMPLALLEAMAAGKAVIASKAGGIPEIITDGTNGVLVAPQDVAALARAMRRLGEDPGLRRRLGRRARLSARGFGWKDIARRYRALYA